MGLYVLSMVLGRFFFNDYKNSPSMEWIVGLLTLITPFAPVGTLFGTLKEDQTTRKKMTIIICTGLSVPFLILLVWGMAYAAAFD